MKKQRTILILLIAVMAVLLTACGGNGQGTYFPSSSEMQENLQKKRYDVTVQTVQAEDYSGTHLSAKKGDEFIEFYWLDEGSAVASLQLELEAKYPSYNKSVSMESDSKFGTLVFCASEKAAKHAGIVIVDVKVKI